MEKADVHGHVGALNSLGVLYANCQGVKRDYNKAVEYYKKAAELGNDCAFYSLTME